MAGIFKTGAQFPPESSIERLAKYERGRKIFAGKTYEVFDRASDILKDTPAAPQLEKLYIAVNLMDVLITKPADMLVGEAPVFETGKPDNSPEQVAMNRIVEENDLAQMVHETTVGNGFRGDAFYKTYFDYRQDFSELTEIPDGVTKEPIIESQNPSYVFPELSRGSTKKFKAVNIAYVEWVETGKDEIPYLVVERHVPGEIQHSRYKLQFSEGSVDVKYGVPITIYRIGDAVNTGRESDVEFTGVPRILVHHAPYKTTDETWEGISGVEKLESVLAAIQDRLVQIDYILWKHSDPTAYGPDLEGAHGDSVQFGGKYIPIEENDATPGYMTWDGQLDAAFKELDYLLGLVYQMSETPQWLFGTTITAGDKGGTGTSHTDGAAIRARFMPILSKVKRIRVHVDKALREAVWTAMELDNYANEDVEGFEPYTAVYPKIRWNDGLPRNEKEEAEIMAIRTGNKPTLDVRSAIKKQDDVDDEKATEVIARIKKDEEDAYGTVDASIFNLPEPVADE
ncbi:phage portal protein [Alkalihalobacillus sp. LMS6]|jgi:hypothetical protein|uniref:phage portal protein n=1 Tax=Alkalihalobacillus sp. LMS6 TaxID=2924034 RepID=UPI0020D1255C|nr:phage portal protein [Alkalihalobacillus sp. LMS6]UTR05153.1 phage portal protein [Alkalihalobacillus sp. LMS6]